MYRRGPPPKTTTLSNRVENRFRTDTVECIRTDMHSRISGKGALTFESRLPHNEEIRIVVVGNKL